MKHDVETGTKKREHKEEGKKKRKSRKKLKREDGASLNHETDREKEEPATSKDRCWSSKSKKHDETRMVSSPSSPESQSPSLLFEDVADADTMSNEDKLKQKQKKRGKSEVRKKDKQKKEKKKKRDKKAKRESTSSEQLRPGQDDDNDDGEDNDDDNGTHGKKKKRCKSEKLKKLKQQKEEEHKALTTSTMPSQIVESSAIEFYDEQIKQRKEQQQKKEKEEEDVRAQDKHALTLLLFYQYIEPVWDEKTYTFMLTRLQKVGRDLQLTGRMRVAREGLNCTLTGSHESIVEYCRTLKRLRPTEFSDTEFKLTSDLPQAQRFPNLKVFKVVELVHYGLEGSKAPPIAKFSGTHLEPKDYHKKLGESNTVIIDVRNHYEAAIGRFVPPEAGTGVKDGEEPPKWLDPKMRKSTEFPAWLDRPEVKEEMKGKQVLMYCTGNFHIICCTRDAISK